MVDVVVEQSPSAITGAMGTVQRILQLFFDLLPWMIGLLVIVILGIIIYVLFVKKEEEERERDEPAYFMYKQTIRSCRLNAVGNKIRKTYRLINLLWLGIPILWNEHSVKVVDMSNNVVGWYRGEAKEMDNTFNLLLYKTKTFIFFEDTFILKIPIRLQFNIPTTNDNGNILLGVDNKPIYKKKSVNLMNYIKQMPNGDLKLYCASIQKIGQYYYCPVFVIDNDKGFLDYRKMLEGTIIDNTYQQMVTRLLNTGAQQMEKGMVFNPYLQYAQKAPQKTAEEKKVDDEV